MGPLESTEDVDVTMVTSTSSNTDDAMKTSIDQTTLTNDLSTIAPSDVDVVNVVDAESDDADVAEVNDDRFDMDGSLINGVKNSYFLVGIGIFVLILWCFCMVVFYRQYNDRFVKETVPDEEDDWHL